MNPWPQILHCLYWTPSVDNTPRHTLHGEAAAAALNGHRWDGVPVLFWGPPGIGKTAVASATPRRYGAPCEILSPGQRGEGAFGVVPVPDLDGDRRVLTYPPPTWAYRLREAGAGLVLLDEMTQAGPALTPPLLGLVQLGAIGDEYLPPGVRRWATANATNQGGQWEPPASLANRFLHLDWPDVADGGWVRGWRMGLSTGWLPDESVAADAATEEARVLAAWPAAWAQACAVVGTFVERRAAPGGFFHKLPAEGDPAASRAWPSPRTWEMTAILWASVLVHQLDEESRDVLIAGAVGTGPGNELAAFATDLAFPDLEGLLDGTVSWTPDPSRLDACMAITDGCAALVVAREEQRKKDSTRHKKSDVDAALERTWELIGTVVSAGHPDCVVPAGERLAKAQLGRMRSKAALAPLRKLHPMLSAGAGED